MGLCSFLNGTVSDTLFRFILCSYLTPLLRRGGAKGEERGRPILSRTCRETGLFRSSAQSNRGISSAIYLGHAAGVTGIPPPRDPRSVNEQRGNEIDRDDADRPPVTSSGREIDNEGR